MHETFRGRQSNEQPLDFDDIEIPAAKTKVQNFEELLMLKLQEEDPGFVHNPVADQNESDDGKPKRQFLKKKSSAIVPSQLPTKKYTYYADAVTGKKSSTDTLEPMNKAEAVQAKPRTPFSR